MGLFTKLETISDSSITTNIIKDPIDLPHKIEFI